MMMLSRQRCAAAASSRVGELCRGQPRALASPTGRPTAAPLLMMAPFNLRPSSLVSSGHARRCLKVRAETESGDKTQKTLSNLDNLLGIEPETEPEPEPEPEQAPPPVPEVTASKIESTPSTPDKAGGRDWLLEGFEEDGVPDIANRSLSSIGYVLPLLDGLHYAKYLFLQAPQLAIVLLPLAPAIEIFEQFRWLQIVFFFALALGVANNRNLPAFTRFNAQQAILLDIIQILPDVLLGNKGPPPGDDFLLQATILISNTVFIYVYLCCLSGVVGSLNGKAVRLPLLGGAAETQANR